jgi:hypothetical protein
MTDVSDLNGNRRTILKAAGVAAGVSALGPQVQAAPAESKGEQLGTPLFVETAVKYEPHDTFPVLHWDGLPPHVASPSSGELQLTVFASDDQMATVRENDAVVASRNVKAEFSYHDLQGGVAAPAGDVTEIALSPSERVALASSPGELPARLSTTDGDVTVAAGSQTATVAPGEHRRVGLTSRGVTRQTESGRADAGEVTPVLVVRNYGRLDAFAPAESSE